MVTEALSLNLQRPLIRNYHVNKLESATIEIFQNITYKITKLLM